MAACSSSQAIPDRCELLSCSSHDVAAHHIFLSHSGAQKPFVEALYRRLRVRYTTFFDITHHSLPLGEPFPKHIFHAAATCRLAVVVLSEQFFVQSKWTMLELCAFFKAKPQPKILPLFLKLTPLDLKQEKNFDKWRSTWQKFAEEGGRIDLAEWESAFRKLSSYNGLVINQCEEESTYIERVFSGICESVHPSIRYDLSGIQGIHRLSEMVLAEFKELNNDQSKVCVLGMYGVTGSGKSTICRYLCRYLFSEFAGKAIHWELPTGADKEEMLIKGKELLTRRTNFNSKMDLSSVSDIREVYPLLKSTDFASSKKFLVVDNISSQESANVVKALLRLGLTMGSKVLLVAHSINVLRPLLQEDGSHQPSHYVYGSMNVPSLNEEEALRVLLQSGDGLGLAVSYAPDAALTPRNKQFMEEVVSMSGFSEGYGGMYYVPMVLKIMGDRLREYQPNLEEWRTNLERLKKLSWQHKKEALQQMAFESFEKLPGKLRTLFLDVALFLLPLSYSDGVSHKLDEVCSHLCLIRGCESEEEIESEMQQLQHLGLLTIREGFSTTTISVHDFYLEFAASFEEASKYYWNCGLRWSKIQHNQAIEALAVKQLELRTVVLQLDERYEHFVIPVGFSTVRAMVLRNCKALKTLGGFSNLTSLVSLEIRDCPSLEGVERLATGHKQSCNIQRFTWVNKGTGNIIKEGNQEVILGTSTPHWIQETSHDSGWLPSSNERASGL